MEQRNPLLPPQETTTIEETGNENIIHFSEPRSVSPLSAMEPLSRVSEHSIKKPHVESTSSISSGSKNESVARDATWLPYTLRWYCFIVPTTLAAALCLVVSLLLWHSRRNYGLGNDDGSSGLLFGWRFTPTIIAVLYVQQIVMLFEDIKRSEPFARLAKPSGADARISILQAPRPWWFCLSDGFSRKKNGGRRNWLLVISTCVYIMSVFGISPLSASLLAPTEVSMLSEIRFNRIVPGMDTEIPLTAGRETYFRTFGNLLQNVSTSAWLPDSYVVMPFWPSNAGMNVGPVINQTEQQWRAETVVFRNDFECTPLKVTSKESRVEVQEDETNRYEYRYLTLGMESSDGCTYNLEINTHWFTDLVMIGGAQWTTLDSLFYSPDMKKITANASGVGYEDPYGIYQEYFKVKKSKECGNRELLLATSPVWEVPEYNPNVTVPATIYANHTMQSHVCASTPYMATMPVTVSLSFSNSVVKVDDVEFDKRRQPVPQSLLNQSHLQEHYIHGNWSKYMSQTRLFERGEITGPAALLSAWYKFNATNMAHAADLTERAKQIRQRFFGELLMSSVINAGTTVEQNFQGEKTVTQRRVIVVTETAIALASLFCASFLILVGIYFFSRPSRRPLQLSENPWTTVGAASLISSEPLPQSLSGHLASSTSRKSDTSALLDTKFALRSGALRVVSTTSRNRETPEEIAPNPNKSDQRPAVTRLRTMLTLLLYLVLLAVALAVLYDFARRSRLYQTAFIYRKELPFFNQRLSTIAPYSIVPTFLAVCVGLWWDALDKSFRAMQPYLSMSQRPTRLSDGVSLSYQSSYWAWAAAKAAKHKHWTLFAITFGSTICQVFTVSMSALFEREPGQIFSSVPIERTLELQQVPNSQPLVGGYNPGTTGGTTVLRGLFENADTGWMYTAAIQLILNGTEPAWSRNGWSFVQVDLSHVERHSVQKAQQDSDDPDSNASLFSSMNVTIHTQALRARVECNPIDTSNASAWFQSVNLTDPYVWNVTANPKDWETAWRAGRIGGDEDWNTSLFAHPTYLSCCENTSNPEDMVALGYWSTPQAYSQPHSFEPWPVNLTSKWLYGRGREYGRNTNVSSSMADRVEEINAPYLMFREPPELQVLTCAPTIESANAEVTVDRDTGDVLSYNILDKETAWETQAWSDPFVIHNSTQICVDRFPNTNWTDPLEAAATNCSWTNVTTSYGVMFMSALTSAAHLTSLEGVTFKDYHWRVEDLEDMTFNIRDRDQGLSMDFMTFAMYNLVGKDPEALLNADTLTTTTQRVFSTFFQHFVSQSVSVKDGGFAYQPIGHTIEDPGPVYNISFVRTSTIEDHLPANYSNEYPQLNTVRQASAIVSSRIEVLRMNPTATWLSFGILCWLMITTVVVAAVERKNVKRLNSGMDTLGSVLVWVAGSENLLGLVREGTAKELEKNGNVWTRLGWFKDGRGVIRWGVEAEGRHGMQPVEWVDPPKDAGSEKEKSRESVGSGGYTLLGRFKASGRRSS